MPAAGSLDACDDPVRIRKAMLADVPAIRTLIATSARILGAGDYTGEQIEAALLGVWGVDTEIIRDETYFVGEADNELVLCGGWSRRATLFGGDAYAQRESRLLDSRTEGARIRAFFVHPKWARRGRLYARYGYVATGRRSDILPGGVSIDSVPMRKAF